MSDLNFITDGTIERISKQRRHYEEVVRECFANQAKHLQNDAEKSTDYCRDLIRSGADATEELNELETFANGFLLAVLLLKREASNG